MHYPVDNLSIYQCI